MQASIIPAVAVITITGNIINTNTNLLTLYLLHSDSENEPLLPASLIGRLNPTVEEEEDNQSTVVNMGSDEEPDDHRRFNHLTDATLNYINDVNIASTGQARDWIRRERNRRARHDPSSWRSYRDIIFDLLLVSRRLPRALNRFICNWMAQEDSNFIMRRMRRFSDQAWLLIWQLLLELTMSLIEAMPMVGKVAIGIVLNDAFDIVSFTDPDKVISRLENIQDMVNNGDQWTASEPILGNTVNASNNEDTEMKCDD